MTKDSIPDLNSKENQIIINKNKFCLSKITCIKPTTGNSMIYKYILCIFIFLNLFDKIKNQNTSVNINNTNFDPNIYYNTNFTKLKASYIPEISLVTNLACFKTLLPVIGLLSDYEQAILVKAALQNTDQNRCIDCQFYSNNLINVAKKELATAIQFQYISSFTKREPLRCLLNIVNFIENNTTRSGSNNVIFPNLVTSPVNITGTNITNEQLNQTRRNFTNENIVLQGSRDRSKINSRPFLNKITQIVNDFIYFQTLTNKCASVFLYQVEMLLMNRRRYFCARLNDFRNISIYDSNNQIMGFKWTYKESEILSDIFRNYAECKSFENIIYPQVINKAFGIIASNSPCNVKGEILVTPSNIIGANTVNSTNLTILNNTINTTNPTRFLQQKMFTLKSKNKFYKI